MNEQSLEAMLEHAKRRARDSKVATAKLLEVVARLAAPICRAATEADISCYVEVDLRHEDFDGRWYLALQAGALWIAPEDDYLPGKPSSFEIRRKVPQGDWREGWFVADDGLATDGTPANPAEPWSGWSVAPRHILILVPEALRRLTARLAEVAEKRASETEDAAQEAIRSLP